MFVWAEVRSNAKGLAVGTGELRVMTLLRMSVLYNSFFRLLYKYELGNMTCFIVFCYG